MHILLTNDNGYTAAGLTPLARALRLFGKVTVLVPENDWSLADSTLFQEPMRVRLSVLPDDGTSAIVCRATPSDCVSYALMGFLSQDVDLVVSGVNVMPTAQHHLAYSAGVTAVTEALMLGIPGVAVSMPGGVGEVAWQTAVNLTCHVVQRFISEGFPKRRFYNVQVPSGRVCGIRNAQQDLRVYYERLASRQEMEHDEVVPPFINATSMTCDEPTAVLAQGYALITTLLLNPVAAQALAAQAPFGQQGQLLPLEIAG
ncbi:MAG: hypothetical protein KDE56_19180 [Anaerolineales bacterium]|nr:hypothetical protein [Anaerolineales bacterium]